MRKVIGFLLAAALGTTAHAADVGWPSYNGSLESHRFSPLAEITPKNAADLREVCEAALGDEGAVEAAPLVIGNTLYVTTIHTVVAIDATNCALRWRYIYEATEQEIFPVNRGVAYLDGTLYRGTNDGRLVSIGPRAARNSGASRSPIRPSASSSPQRRSYGTAWSSSGPPAAIGASMAG